MLGGNAFVDDQASQRMSWNGNEDQPSSPHGKLTEFNLMLILLKTFQKCSF